MKGMHYISVVLVIVGALNWGLEGLGYFMSANWNVVEMIFGAGTSITSIIYVLVGLAGVYLIFTHKNDCKVCAAGGMM